MGVEPDQLQFAADFNTAHFSTVIGTHKELQWKMNLVMN